MTTIKIIENGPALIADVDSNRLVDGTIEISQGKISVMKEGVIALCRCSKSTNQPYCDGSHKKTQE